MSAKGPEWICLNEKCEKYKKIVIRSFDALSDNTCNSCGGILKLYKRYKHQDRRAKEQLSQFHPNYKVSSRIY